MTNSTFPALASILSPQALAEEVIPGFGVGRAARVDYFSGGFNDTYRVKTEDGVTYYLRCYRPRWRNLDDIRYELDVLKHLQKKSFPAAVPLEYRDGELYCSVLAPEGKRYIALFTEAPGPEITYDREPEKIAQHYGGAVARMHHALDDFSSCYERFQLDLEYFIDRSLENIQPFLEHRPEDWEHLRRFAEKLRQKVTNLPESALEKGFCHGDLQGYHANVASDGTLTFYDFDCGGFGYRAYDLAVFLWCCRLQDAVTARWEPFLQGYCQTRSINEVDIKAVPLFVCARYLWHMGVHTQNSPDWGIGFLNDGYFNEHLKRIKSAEEDYLDQD